jgi:Cu2+-exporting ATPase
MQHSTHDSLDLIIFDKTGTLTRGSPAVSGVTAAPGIAENDLIAYAAAVESNSEHPIAKAIVAETKRRGVAQTLNHQFRGAGWSRRGKRSWRARL